MFYICGCLLVIVKSVFDMFLIYVRGIFVYMFVMSNEKMFIFSPISCFRDYG
jgi:hypothetical protein